MLITYDKIKNWMSTDLVTVKETDQLSKIRQIFKEKIIHHIPVVDEKNRLKGMVSLIDYAIALDPMTPFGNAQTQKNNQKTFDTFLVGDVMTDNVITLTSEHSLHAAISIFKENLFRAIPIVNENEELLGMITTYDIMICLDQ